MMSEPRPREALIERVRLTAPPQMLQAVRWLVWKSVPGEGKKARKVPYYVDSETPRTGVLDSDADREHFASFEAAAARLLEGNYEGLGFALGPDGTGNHWQGVDFDGSTERARALLELYPTYNDVSPSGNGAHLYGYGRPFHTLGNNGTGIECYSHGRYLTVTGQILAPADNLIDLSSLYPTLAEIHSPHVERDENVTRDKHTGSFTVNERTLAELQLALEFISPDDYHTWVRIGHALRTVGAHDLWVAWSRKSKKWREHDAKKWATFKPDRVSYKTVFYVAQEAGWKNVTLTEEVRRSRIELLSIDQLFKRPVPTWRVREVMPSHGIGMIYGEPGSGKTFLALDLALACAHREQWFERKVKQCPTVYIAAEGVLRNRVDAYTRKHGKVEGFLAVNQRIDLFAAASGDRRALIDALKDAQERIGDIGVVVIDTVNRAFPGANENAPDDMSRVIDVFGEVAELIDGIAIGVHHPGKDETRGLRGHSSLLGAIDFSMFVKRSGIGNEWSVQKVKEGELGVAGSFQLPIVELGLDADGEKLRSCIVSPVPGSPAAEPTTPAHEVWSALQEAGGRARVAAVRAIFDCHAESLSDATRRKRWERGVTKLKETKKIKETKGWFEIVT